MEARLYRAADTLKNFLDDELSETYLGLPAGSRAHLERFRSFLMSYYTTQLGYYPPRIFDSNMFRMMREDFEALYELLADNGYDSSETMPAIAVGGICTLQLVQDFDDTHEYIPLDHPLPLLPYVAENSTSQRMSWLPRGVRTKPDQRLVKHAALIKATNWKKEFFTNELVRAYRRFEEDSILSPNKADKQEKVSLIDARKVRWLLIYAVYQVLKNVTEEPIEVQDDLDAHYHLSISTDMLPTWKQRHELGFLIRSQTDMVRASSLTGTLDTRPRMPEPKIEIKPDIDYHALTHKESLNHGRDGSMPEMLSHTAPVTRSNSVSRALSLTRRRSLMFFKSSSGTPPIPSRSSTRSAHHEIVVQGYGNGTNEVQLDDQQPVPSGSWASRSDSSASNPASSVGSVFDLADADDGDETSSETPVSSIKTSSPTATFADIDDEWDAVPAPLNVTAKRWDVVSMMIPSMPSRRGSLGRPISAVLDMSVFKPAESPIEAGLVDSPTLGWTNNMGDSPTLGRSHSFLQRTATRRLPDLRRRSFVPTTATRKVSEDNDDVVRFITDEKAEWASMQSWLDGDNDRLEVSGRNGKGDAWGQFAELGGLTEIR